MAEENKAFSIEVAWKHYDTQLQPRTQECAPVEVQSLRAAARSNSVTVTKPVQITLVLVILAAFGLVAFVVYSLHLTQSHDANLEDTILDGTTEEMLIALKRQNVQAYSIIYGIVIALLVLIMLIVFGYQLFYTDVSRRKDEQKQQVLREAEDAITDLRINREKLKADVEQSQIRIERLQEKEMKNEKEIKRLKLEKSEKEKKLAATEEKLKSVRDGTDEEEENWKPLHDSGIRSRGANSGPSQDKHGSKASTAQAKKRSCIIS